MIQSKYSTVFDEVTYDINELADLYWSELNHMSKQYGEKMKWPKTKKQAYAPGMEAVAHADFGIPTLCHWEPIKRIYDRFNFPDCVGADAREDGIAEEYEMRPYAPNDVDLLVYRKDYLFVPHVDYHQNCVMMLPIWPLDGGTPVKYHKFENQVAYIQEQIREHRKGKEVVYNDIPDWQPGDPLPKHLKFRHMDPYEDVDEYVHYSTKHPTLINGRFIHSIGPVKEDIRVYLRFKFLPPITYDGLIELHKQGKWIKPE